MVHNILAVEQCAGSHVRRAAVYKLLLQVGGLLGGVVLAMLCRNVHPW